MPLLDTFTRLLNINPAAGRFIAAGLLALVAAAIVVSFGIAEDLLIRMALYVVAFAVVVVVLTNIQGLVIRLVGWILTLAFLLWLAAFLAQTLTGGRIAFLAPVQCLAYPMSDACSIIRSTSVEPETVVTETAIDASGFEGLTSVTINYVGAIEETAMTAFAGTLSAAGWPVADTGATRTALATGLNEVWFFHEDDRAAAETLAQSAAASSPAGDPVAVRSLAGTAFATDETKGVLELWISN